MTAITTRAGKGSKLTHNEVDQNFTNLNADKLEKSILATNHSVLVRNSAGELVEIVLAEDRLFGRLAGGQVVGLTATQVRGLLGIGEDMLAIEDLSPSDDDIIMRLAGNWDLANMATLKSKLALIKGDLEERARFAANFDGGGGTVISVIDTWVKVNHGVESIEGLEGFDHASGRFTFNQAVGKDIHVVWSGKAAVAGAAATKHIAAELRVFNGEDAYQYSIGQAETVIPPIGGSAGVATLSACGTRAFAGDWYAELWCKNILTTDDITFSDISLKGEEL